MTKPPPPAKAPTPPDRPHPALEHELDPQRAARWAQWRLDNAEAIAAYNERVRKHGCFSSLLRQR